jgi:hypothetical protein
MNTANNPHHAPNSGGLAIQLVVTACDIGAGVALVCWLWPSGVMDPPLAAVPVPLLLRSVAAIVLAVGAILMLVAIWSSDDPDKVNPR